MKSMRYAVLALCAVNLLIGTASIVKSQSFTGRPIIFSGQPVDASDWVRTTAASQTIASWSGGAGTGTVVSYCNNNPCRTLTEAELRRMRGIPEGATHHQVVDNYFDDAGNKVETKSRTHLVDAEYCQPGTHRNPEDAVAQDDGKGNVVFAQLRQGNEFIDGQRPITRADLIKVQLAASNKAAPAAEPVSGPVFASR